MASWDELRKEASNVLLSFLKGEEQPTDKDLSKAKVASSVLSSFTRHEQTASARETTAVMVGKMIYEDRDTFEAYVRVATPGIKLPKPKGLPGNNPAGAFADLE